MARYTSIFEREQFQKRLGGRPAGAKNKTEIEKLFKKIQFAVNVGNRKGLEELAQPLVDEIATTMPGFNDYTEALANSYAATVFSNRKPVKTVFHDTGHRGIVRRSRGKNAKGGRWVYLTNRRHGLGGRITYNKGTKNEYSQYGRNVRDPRKKRYLKSWEKLGGEYRKNTWGGRRNGRQIGYTPMTSGAPQAQNWLVIENRAPYADWVNRGVRNPLSGKRNSPRRVMQNAVVRKIGPRATELVRTVVLKELKAAGFKVK